MQLNKIVERTKQHEVTKLLQDKTRKEESSITRLIGAKTQLMKSPVSSRNIPMITESKGHRRILQSIISSQQLKFSGEEKEISPQSSPESRP